MVAHGLLRAEPWSLWPMRCSSTCMRIVHWVNAPFRDFFCEIWVVARNAKFGSQFGCPWRNLGILWSFPIDLSLIFVQFCQFWSFLFNVFSMCGACWSRNTKFGAQFGCIWCEMRNEIGVGPLRKRALPLIVHPYAMQVGPRPMLPMWGMAPCMEGWLLGAPAPRYAHAPMWYTPPFSSPPGILPLQAGGHTTCTSFAGAAVLNAGMGLRLHAHSGRRTAGVLRIAALRHGGRRGRASPHAIRAPRRRAHVADFIARNVLTDTGEGFSFLLKVID